ncbi:MAG: efflux RND transporter periplasmic adaptor subunit [Nitrospirae bacterium]|nr:efflux RND transporter periplasmic adaptor subunit [Nitrospirota bacterium]
MSSKTLVITAVLGVVLAAGVVSCKPKPPAGPPQMPPATVTAVTLSASQVTVTEDYVGQTEAKDTVEIRARVGGILERQAFVDGERVVKGQLLYVIDQETYKVALASAKASLAAAKASLAQARANALRAQQDLERTKPLAEAQAVSRQQLDTAVAAEAAGKAQVEAAEAAVKQAEAAVSQAELNLAYTAVTAPRDGDVSASLVRAGSLISPASTLMATLYSLDPMYINTTVSEERLLQLKRQYGAGLGKGIASGPPVKVLLTDGSEYRFPGRINYFGAAVDRDTGTLAVRVSVPNPDGYLKPGQFVRVVFPGTTIKDAIKVPLQAVQQMQDVKTVLVVGPGNVVEARQIKGENTVGNDLVVESGLKPGETIIVEGTAKAKPGAPVNPVPPGAEQAGGHV